MSKAQYDYDALERQYREGTMSLRELCRMNDIATYSTVTAMAKKRKWDDKREEFQALVQRAEMEIVAEKRAKALENLTDDMVKAMHAATFRFVEQLQDRIVRVNDTDVLVPGITVDAGDLAKLIDKVQLLSGQPTKREATVGIGVNLNGNIEDPSQLPVELLRELVGAARAAGAGKSSMGQSPLPRIERARQVN